jgi:hypothetical protein
MRRKRMVYFGLSVVGMTVPLFGDEETKQPVEVTSTERVSFASGGLIRFSDSYGDLIQISEHGERRARRTGRTVV